MDTSIEINNNYTNIKICECDLTNYYCHCKGEDELLLRLQKIKRLKNRICCHAIKNRHLNIFKWHQTLKKKPCVYILAHYVWPTIQGNLNVLKMLYQQNQFEFCDKMCIPYEGPIFKYAVWNDHIHILKWLIEINSPDKLYYDYDYVRDTKIGINCLKYLFEINETEDILNIENKKEIEYFKFLATCGI
jgi:hypothetical protein